MTGAEQLLPAAVTFQPRFPPQVGFIRARLPLAGPGSQEVSSCLSQHSLMDFSPRFTAPSCCCRRWWSGCGWPSPTPSTGAASPWTAMTSGRRPGCSCRGWTASHASSSTWAMLWKAPAVLGAPWKSSFAASPRSQISLCCDTRLTFWYFER